MCAFTMFESLLVLLSLFLQTTEAAVAEAWGDSLIAYCVTSKNAKTFDEAKSHCKSYYGTELAVLDSKSKFQEAKALMLATGNCTWDSWIGLSYDSDLEAWQWQSGAQLTEASSYEQWDDNEPQPMNWTADDQKYCGEMQHPVDYKWRAEFCDARKKQWLCGTPSIRWVHATYHSLFLSNEPITWTQAQRFCRVHMGSDLGTTHSTAEVTNLRDVIHASDLWPYNGLDSEKHFHFGLTKDKDLIEKYSPIPERVVANSNEEEDVEFQNVDGSRTDLNLWLTGQFHDSSGQKCSKLRYFGYTDYDPYNNFQMKLLVHNCDNVLGGVVSGALHQFACNNQNMFYSRLNVSKEDSSSTANETLTTTTTQFDDSDNGEEEEKEEEKDKFPYGHFVIVQSPNDLSDESEFRHALQKKWTWNQASSYCLSRLGRNLAAPMNETLWREFLLLLEDYSEEYMSRWPQWNASELQPALIGVSTFWYDGQWLWQAASGTPYGSLDLEFLKQDSIWIEDSYNDTIEALSADSIRYYAFVDVNPNNAGGSYAKLGLMHWSVAESMAFVCNVLPFADASEYEYSLTVKRNIGTHNRKQMLWVYTEPYAVNWQTANDICFQYYGTHLLSVHHNGTRKLIHRAIKGKAGSYTDVTGWLGGMYLASTPRWVDGSRYGLNRWQFRASKTMPSDTTPYCTYSYEYMATEPEQTIGWTDCAGSYQYFMCSAVREKWSTHPSLLDSEQYTHGAYQVDDAWPRFALLRINDFSLKPKQINKWCDRRYNTHCGIVSKKGRYKELVQLLMDEGLLHTNTSGSGVKVVVGARYNAQMNKWQWANGRTVNIHNKGWMRTRGVKNKKGQCLAIDTSDNKFVSVHCKHFAATAWVCDSPRSAEGKHAFRNPIRGKFCVNPWLYALLSAILATLSTASYWYCLRSIQYDTFMQPRNRALLTKVEMEELFSNPLSDFGSDYEYREFINDQLIDNYNVPYVVCHIIHEYSGKATLENWIELQFDRNRTLVVLSRDYFVWFVPAARIACFFLSTIALFLFYFDFVATHKTPWIQFGAFWIIWMVHPTTVKFAAQIEHTCRCKELANCVLGRDIAPKLHALFDVLDYNQLFALIVFGGMWMSSPICGPLVWPWIGVCGLLAWFHFDTLWNIDGFDVGDFFPAYQRFSTNMKVSAESIRKMNSAQFVGCVKRLFVTCLIASLIWMLFAVGGVTFFMFCTGGGYFEVHKRAWKGDYCQSYFDFDAFDWRAWVLFLHWILF